MEFKLTNEEVEAIKYYRNEAFENINQLLNSDSRVDIALLTDEENEEIKLNYDKESVVQDIETIKKIYSAILKRYLSKGRKEDWTFSKKCPLTEIEKLKNETYIDRFLITDTSQVQSENAIGMNQTVLYICGDKDVPYIMLKEVLENDNNEVLIAPFTEIGELLDGAEIEEEDRKIRTYSLKLRCQELQEMSDDDKIALYNYIISNSDLVNTTLSNTVKLEKENVANYESIRELEKQISDLEMTMNQKEQEQDYSESARRADSMDLNELNDKLEILKNHSTDIFNNIKSNNKFITEWKKNITVYLMAECSDIEEELIGEMQAENDNAIEEAKVFAQLPRIEKEKLKDESFENILQEVKAECADNKILVQRLINDINRLISRQQNFAKIAGNLGASYSALNNSFEMKSKAEKLEVLIDTIKLKVSSLAEEDSKLSGKKLLEISEVNNQINILMNYLNNPKAAIAKSKMNRFDEMIVVEENELKRDIARAILDIRGEAELKKLRDDTQIIEDKGPLQKFLGIFTGQNKLDEFMIEQIQVRQNSIKKTLSKKLRLDYNYSVHEFVAEIRMFIRDNEDDELVMDDVEDLREFEKEICKNFVIIDSKVEDIIAEKESKNLPVDTKITKKELIEIETYRFLNKYGYDIAEKQEPEEVQYTDTTANEIGRIIDYINTSKVLE
ncbi:MAG: hypothetical protein IJ867_08035 [Clostridia bacterium]|nr:hypothetical protein [Clostridia bacterium]